jgi:hypothetical protein
LQGVVVDADTATISSPGSVVQNTVFRKIPVPCSYTTPSMEWTRCCCYIGLSCVCVCDELHYSKQRATHNLARVDSCRRGHVVSWSRMTQTKSQETTKRR